ncbi:hypothetical protein ARMSODRAFT_102879 [Armillaria solidipes]|uniref:Secreted protein n=1 Tax=Armillaria solidipes TaxID=1076256 RepID=A0A2H3AV13_9AGAR|nr:hypothetical protein ARMSODRAFT_102879 [Armillaria solidipes]
MGPSSAADAALFLEMVCCNVVLARCLRFCCFHGPKFYCSCCRAFSWMAACLTQCLRFVGSIP